MYLCGLFVCFFFFFFEIDLCAPLGTEPYVALRVYVCTLGVNTSM